LEFRRVLFRSARRAASPAGTRSGRAGAAPPPAAAPTPPRPPPATRRAPPRRGEPPHRPSTTARGRDGSAAARRRAYATTLPASATPTGPPAVVGCALATIRGRDPAAPPRTARPAATGGDHDPAAGRRRRTAGAA